ncbi:hypothetical protein Tco_0683016 [Tanacetum coccineum]|uniref:Uncharacterized protein n=1 Tax=Tanacetum coccineum TaxID=301880 RepID=A0ABQ4XTR4_9ASTR
MNEDYCEQNSCYDPNSFGFDQYQPPQFPVNYPPQETNKEILQAREDLMEAIQAFLKEYDNIPLNEKCMALLLAEERFLKIKQTMKEEQNQPKILQELLLKLMNDLQILKGSKQEKKETAAQSFTPYWDVSMIGDEEARDNFLKDVCTFLRKFSRIPFGVTPKVILIAWESFGKIKDALMDKQYQQEDIQELMSKLLEDVRNISEEFSEYINCPSWNRPLFYFDDDDDEYTVIWRRPKAITPVLPTREPEDSLIMGDEHLDTIPEKESDELIKSSVENLVPIPSESEDFSENESECDMPVCDDFTTFSNPLFDLNGDFTSSDDMSITPVLSTKEPVDSLIMEDEHLDTVPATESDEVIKSSVENLVPIPSEFKGIFEDTCDVPVCEDPSTFDALSDHSEILSDSNDDDTSSDDDSYENIEYVEASPSNSELVSLEEVEDVILRDKLSNVYLLISKIEALNDNPTLSSFSDNTFSDHTEETRSGSTTTHANNSLPEYDSFLFEIEPDQGGLTGIVISDNSNDPLLELPEFESFHFDFDPSFPRPPLEPPDVEISLIIKTDAPVINNVDKLNKDECFNPGGGENNVEVDDSFTIVTRTFLPFLTYPEVSPLLSSTKNEDTIYDPGIST